MTDLTAVSLFAGIGGSGSRSMLLDPALNVFGAPDLAHAEHGVRLREVGPRNDLLNALATDAAEAHGDLGSAHQMVHNGKHSQHATCRLTRGQESWETSHMPRGVYPHTHVKPKDYPPEMVAEVRELYETGHTQYEIAAKLGASQKVIWRLMQNHGIQARVAAVRDQRGEKNAYWRGDDAGYAGFHRRVEYSRGKPEHCSACDRSGPGRYEWANLTGHYEDIKDYVRLCTDCHRTFDKRRRDVTGERTSPVDCTPGAKGGGAACPRT